MATYKTGQRAILSARLLAGHGHRTVIRAIKGFSVNTYEGTKGVTRYCQQADVIWFFDEAV